MRYWLVIAIGVGFLLSILPNIYAQENISSPLKQFKSGIPAQDIKCKEGFVLIIKTDGEPICVKPTSVSRLLSHGWITLEKFETTHPILQQNKTNATSVTNETQSYCSKVSDDFKGQQVSELVLTPKVISSSGHVKFLCIGMSPNSLKVGDDVFFGADVQNISDGPIWIKVGPCFSSLLYTITPEENVQEYPCDNRMKIAVGMAPLAPGVHGVVHAISGHLGGWYKITKPGMLTVTMTLQSIIIDRNLTDLNNVTNPYDYNMKSKQDFDKWYSTDERVVSDTIQFNVNATQNGTDTNQSVINDTSIISNQTSVDNLTASTQEQSVRVFSVIDNSTLPITPKVIPVMDGIVKPLSIGIIPSPVKVGGPLFFKATFQNISDQSFYVMGGCRATSLFDTITPADHLKEYGEPLKMCSDYSKKIEPQGIFIQYAHEPPSEDTKHGAYYEIITPGILHVTLELYGTDQKSGWTLIDKIQFDVNATQ